MVTSHQTLISAVEVENLFGRYSYEMNFSNTESPQSRADRLTLIYGSNGTGKTTILKLLWHTLSPANSRGHRTSIAKTPFESFSVHLTNGDVIRIAKLEGLYGSFVAQVRSAGKQKVEQFYYLDTSGENVVSVPHNLERQGSRQMAIDIDSPPMEWQDRAAAIRDLEIRRLSRRQRDDDDAFVTYLTGLNAAPYLLADDRKIYGDKIAHKQDEEWSYHVTLDTGRVSPERVNPDDRGGVTGELTTAISRANDVIQRQMLTGGYRGSSRSNNAYVEILRRAALTDLAKADESTRDALIERIEELANETLEYSRYGLLPELDRDTFVNAIKDVPPTKISVVEDVLTPFIDAQKARLEALVSTLDLVRTFTGEMNRFFKSSGKQVTYGRAEGIEVHAARGVPAAQPLARRPRHRRRETQLSPKQLSSGERQILLLLLNTILARENTRVFLIDEPELSLNVKWQRQLMDALLACTEGSAVQFIVATHSIEVLTGHRASIARMIPRNNEAEALPIEEGE
ncbi:AAA family ATPase [Streptomyces sp. NPDC006627]|uniref:AAA family ATPase n=1 Tax=Streptomyces sp. NPDC006627 TaxID=3154679 RepID=UPI0033ABA6C1